MQGYACLCATTRAMRATQVLRCRTGLGTGTLQLFEYSVVKLVLSNHGSAKIVLSVFFSLVCVCCCFLVCVGNYYLPTRLGTLPRFLGYTFSRCGYGRQSSIFFGDDVLPGTLHRWMSGALGFVQGPAGGLLCLAFPPAEQDSGPETSCCDVFA